MVEHQSNGYGVASLVLGIVSIVLCWIPIAGLTSGILGIVFYTKQKKIHPSGIAVGGLVTGIIGTVFSVIYSLIWLLAILAINAAI